MNVTLRRMSQTINGTFGEMSNDSGHLCFTCELPWNNNEHGKSCIPAGRYDCAKFLSRLKGWVWRLLHVPKRQDIEIHSGNTIADSLGCILVGDSIGHLDGKPAVLNSLKALSYLRDVLPDQFQLTIINP